MNRRSSQVYVMVVSVSNCIPENLYHGLLPVIEYLIELFSDKEMGYVTERFKWQAVADLVDDQGSFGTEFGKGVSVYPLCVGSDQLLIDKSEWRFPDRDLGPPFYRQAAHFQFVIDQRTLPDDDRLRRRDLKIELRRRDPLEIAGVGKKIKYVWPRQAERKFACKNVFSHISRRPQDRRK
jgi:hypothetical protein